MRTSIIALLLVLALTVIGLAACGGDDAPAASGGEGDPAAGETLFKLECANCHSVAQGVSLVGPSLAGSGAEDKQSLREEIVNPDAQVTAGFSQGIMPDTFGTQLTPQQIDDLIAFLRTLK